MKPIKVEVIVPEGFRKVEGTELVKKKDRYITNMGSEWGYIPSVFAGTKAEELKFPVIRLV